MVRIVRTVAVVASLAALVLGVRAELPLNVTGTILLMVAPYLAITHLAFRRRAPQEPEPWIVRFSFAWVADGVRGVARRVPRR